MPFKLSGCRSASPDSLDDELSLQAFNGRGGPFLPTPMIGGFQRPMQMGGPGRGMPGMGAMPGRGMNGMMAGRGMNGMAGMPGFGMGGGLRRPSDVYVQDEHTSHCVQNSATDSRCHCDRWRGWRSRRVICK